MESPGSASEYLRIFEHYRAMADEELLALAPQSSELTPVAQQALAAEIRQRGLQVEADAAIQQTPVRPPATRSITSEEWHDFQRVLNGQTENTPRFNSPQAFPGQGPQAEQNSDEEQSGEGDDQNNYEEDRKLVEVCTVYSLRDALQVQRLLDVAGIPFYLGPEDATGVDKVTSNFADGVKVQVMRIGIPWTREPMSHYEPKDDPTPPSEPLPDAPVRCPVCNSTDVIFDAPEGENFDGGVPQKFKWTCGNCGNEWEDDGVAKEA